MEEQLVDLIERLPWENTPWLAWTGLLGLIAISLAVLGKSADWLVKEAVALSERSGMPKAVVGATVVSLGTTAPEAAVSVFAAFKGHPDVALGNAVGSIMCDTGLILGIACMIAPLPLHRNIVNRQGWVQLGAGLLLVLACWPWAAPLTAFSAGGSLPQIAGFGFLVLLAGYMWQSVRWSRAEKANSTLEDLEVDVTAPLGAILGKFVVALLLVLGSAHVLIPAIQQAAERMGVPEFIIAFTLVAFGTSLPELVVAVTAARHGHGELAVGNIVGADILNVLFVAGAAAAVTPAGLEASPKFFQIMFPAMLFVLIVFRVGIFLSGDRLRRPFGMILLATYLVAMALVFIVRNS